MADQPDHLPTSLVNVCSSLRDIPHEERHFAATQFMTCVERLEEVKQYLTNRPPPDLESMLDQNRVLAAWLSGYYAGVSATPSHIMRADMLDKALVGSGAVRAA